ncbi:MarR family transcriptional regulator [Sinomonas terrae]|uniref:MarR family transcriptional regulator n=1 Tax=Sinomonas terrae TaxID=2908838 RepID=A0ABS9U6K6_9MICC|nr:MarR family transcriptional regulator [Sinomonas terrae]MCH6472321.1 MarR family transcriptional regulator [Sinomonas terrae]
MPALPGDSEHSVSLSQVIVTLSGVGARMLEGLALALSEEGASVEQWRILQLVSQLEAPSMGDLAASSGLPNASLSRIVDALEDNASVYRLPTPNDRRRITVRLSDHGAGRLARMNTIVAAWESATCTLIGAENAQALAAAVEGTAERLGVHRVQPA